MIGIVLNHLFQLRQRPNPQQAAAPMPLGWRHRLELHNERDQLKEATDIFNKLIMSLD